MLQRAARDVDVWRLSDFLLLDGLTLNFSAAGSFVKHHSNVDALLRRELCGSGDLLLSNEVALGASSS